MRAAALLLCFFLVALSSSADAPDAPRSYLLRDPELTILTPEDVKARPPAFAFPPGERLEYSVRYFGVPIGTIWLEVARYMEKQGVRMAHLVAGARTNDFFSAIYPIDDVSEAWFDIDRLVTLKTRTHTRHGRRREVWEEVVFDWETHFVHVHEERRHRGTLRQVAFDFGPFAHDTFDLFYALRSLPLEPGYSARLPVYANRKIYAFHVDVNRRERVSSKVLGEVEAVVLRPYDVLDGKPARDGDGEVWVLDTPRRVPLRVIGWFRTTDHFRVGSVRAELMSHRGGTPGWPEPPHPRIQERPWPKPTHDGRPRWKPPKAVKKARKKAGIRPVNRKIPLEQAL